jgi:hypothetical protein
VDASLYGKVFPFHLSLLQNPSNIFNCYLLLYISFHLLGYFIIRIMQHIMIVSSFLVKHNYSWWIHMAVYINSSLCFILKNYFIAWLCTMVFLSYIFWDIFGCVQNLPTANVSMNIHSLCKNMQFLSQCHGTELLHNMVNISLTALQSDCSVLCATGNIHKLMFLHIFLVLGMIECFSFSHVNNSEDVFYISLKITVAEKLFTCLFGSICFLTRNLCSKMSPHLLRCFPLKIWNIHMFWWVQSLCKNVFN